jgi:RES domain-containing protein
LREAAKAGREQFFPAGSKLWRAQLGSDWDDVETEGRIVIAQIPGPLAPERMKPRRNEAIEGRVNPRGIPCLYLATRRDTAIAEVRPWLDAHVSVALFETIRELTIVNVWSDTPMRQVRSYVGEPDAEMRNAAVWADVDWAFSRPVTAKDTTADYAPTQVVAEMFADAGYDGVAYRSALGDGHNVALFDLDAARLRSCVLFQVTGVTVESTECSNPYFIEPRGQSPGDAAAESSDRDGRA